MHGMRDIITVSPGSTIQLTTRFDAEELWTEANANQLELAILNLAINARDAMPGDGQPDVQVGLRMAPAPRLRTAAMSSPGSAIPARAFRGT